MNGIINVYKEKGFTSFDVVAVMRKLCATKKIGHGGTLDPMAEGVLPIFVGNATKAVDYCPETTKEYRAGFRFGITTDTQDITGNIIEEKGGYVSRNKMYLIEKQFTGEMEQLPPMYSAVKVNGRRLYDIARSGEEVEREPRKITVYKIKVNEYQDNQGIMTVECSKGTYIRTLINDIGQSLGTGGVMTSLVRTRSGIFTLDNAYKLDELREMLKKDFDAMEKIAMPVSALYDALPKAHLDEQQTRLYRNGAVLDANRIKFDRIYGGQYSVETFDGKFIALAKISPSHDLEIIQRFTADEGEERPRIPKDELKEVCF